MEPFLGKWSGRWWSHAGKGAGEVNVLLIERFLSNAVSFQADLTNADIPGFPRGFSSGVASFEKGRLTLDRGYLRMRFTLQGTGDDLRVEYGIYDSGGRAGDSGEWLLKRSQ
jgi:hypothetical protein